MKVCVLGLWHLGSVTAACLADSGCTVVGCDGDAAAVAGLNEGRAPLFEPGLDALLAKGLAADRLAFTTDAARAAAAADVVWVTYDTPVDDEDRADTDFVVGRARAVFPFLKPGAVVLISSQLPVGSVAALEAAHTAGRFPGPIHFACSPENLRLGKAIEAFTKAERIVVGVRSAEARAVLQSLLAPLCSNILWVSVEAAEMTKHALNAFLATSVTFINEIAMLCEREGVDAAEVERALRSEPRIGQRAYIRPGSGFAGGTLARDVTFLTRIGVRHALPLPLLESIVPSNVGHRKWAFRQIERHFGTGGGKRVAVLGLAYTPGTSAIRRSVAIELCRDLLTWGAEVRAHDPAVSVLPDDLSAVVLRASAMEAAVGADALVLATAWPDYKRLPAAELTAAMREKLIIDPDRFLGDWEHLPTVRYVTIGRRK
jgi:UDPglucose 6-dehydrogenase